MFGTAKDTKSIGSGTTTLIAAGTTLTGGINFNGDLEIEGTVIGNIASADESSRIRVLNSGSVTGDITVATMVINGSVRGDLHADKLIKLAAKAVVQGSVNYRLLEVEKGAEVVGCFVYHPTPSDEDTQLPVDSKELSNSL